jgi:hypothetical protein
MSTEAKERASSFSLRIHHSASRLLQRADYVPRPRCGPERRLSEALAQAERVVPMNPPFIGATSLRVGPLSALDAASRQSHPQAGGALLLEQSRDAGGIGSRACRC